jgi:hypothetical protein
MRKSEQKVEIPINELNKSFFELFNEKILKRDDEIENKIRKSIESNFFSVDQNFKI